MPRSGRIISLGMLFYFAMFVYCLLAHRGFSVMGVSDKELTKVAFHNFLAPIILYQLKMLVAYLVIGTAVGMFSFGFTKFLFDIFKLQKTWPAYFLSAALIVLIHLCFYFRAIALYPQLFIEYLYNAGGWGRSLQVLITDRLGPRPFTITLWALAIMWLLMAVIQVLQKGLSLRKLPNAIIFLLVLAGLLIYGVQYLDERLSPATNKGPNLLVVAGDSIRPDLLSFNGLVKNTSPRIDELARKGVSFDQAYVQLPRTFPSWLNFLTGEYPFQHGIQTMFPSVKARSKKFITLASILKDNGYQTAVVSDFAGDIFSRIELGFDIVHTPYFNFPQLIKMRSLEIHPPILAYFCNYTGRKLLPELQDFATFADPKIQAHDAIKVLKSFRHHDKFFMLVFFSATHFPYAPPYPYYSTFTDPAYKGNYKYSKANLINVKEEITPEDKAQMKNIFEGGIRATDDAIGEILDYLKQNGMAENTIVMFNADHGENMYEYEYGMGHGEHLRGHYVLRFPWVIYDPRKSFAVNRVASQVRSIDFMPTALELLGFTPPQGIPGASLMPLLEAKTQDLQLPVYAETGLWFIHEGPEFFQKLRLAYPDVTRICDYEKYFHNEIVLKDEYDKYTEVAKYRMVMDGGWKIIYMPLPSGVRWELYDLKQDPEERKDVSADEPAQLEVMKKKLQAILLTRPGWTIDQDYFLPVSDQ